MSSNPSTEAPLENFLPSVTFKTISFSNGTTIELSPNDIVVFVGPNNAGKSAALRDLDDLTTAINGNGHPKIVIKSGSLDRRGTTDELFAFLEKNSKVIGERPTRQFFTAGMHVYEQNLSQLWHQNLSSLSRVFAYLLGTETRITDSNAAPAVSLLDVPSSHPIHLLYLDDALEKRISGFFQKAFGKDLMVARLAGSQVPLLVGTKPIIEQNEDRLSESYNKRLNENQPLNLQGDGMRSFASVILRTLAPATMSILLLDEPEAFLHPPQARLLGELIALERTAEGQLFISTHSPDILQGLLKVAPKNLRIIRLQRTKTSNSVKELDKALAKKISSDSIMRFSSVLSGIFHKRVIICESDADCMFYSALLDAPSVQGQENPDALFVQANGKHRMATLTETLRALDVNVDVIGDIDVLNDLAVLKKLVISLGGDWDPIERHAKVVKASIETGAKWLDAKAVAKKISELLTKPQDAGAFSPHLRDEIKSILGQSSPWTAVKSAGQAAIPPGEATKSFQSLLTLCSSAGLWIVPVGELEGFCKTVGNKGPKWVQDVLEHYSAETSTELCQARDFMRQIWNRVPTDSEKV
jgi:ABC-type cobalamin/Fe3+-siderophores transport system ATPase subunit